jgi:hypothetical protein
MSANWVQRIEAWWSAGSSHDIQQSCPNHDLILSLLYLQLCEQRGLLAPGQLQSLCFETDIHLRLCQLLGDICIQLMPIPLAWLTPVVVQPDAFLHLKLACLPELNHPSPMPVEVLGQVYEKWLDRSEGKKTRKSSGIYYTPEAIAHYIVQQTIGKLPHHPAPIRVLDPACGGGIFLLTAYQSLLDQRLEHHLVLSQADRAQILLDCIYGVDIDPQAIAVTQITLLLKLLEDLPDPPHFPLPNLNSNLLCGNAVIGCDFQVSQTAAFVPAIDWELAFAEVRRSGGFDAVIGNPPYLDSEQMTAHAPAWRQYCTQHYRTAVGNWDIYCVFIEKALELCKVGGLTSLVVPNKLASADYAAQARSLLVHENQLCSIRDYSQMAVFAAAVYPLVYVAQKRLPNPDAIVRYEIMTGASVAHQSIDLAYAHFTEHQPWLLSVNPPQLAVLARLRRNFPLLCEVAQITGAATVAEAYALKNLIQELPATQSGDLQLVNSGTIDRYHMLWGQKRLRYLGATYLHPAIPQCLTQHLPPNRFRQASQPKLLVAGMSKQLECAADFQGAILAGKSTSVIVTAIDLRYLLGLLNSNLVSLYFRHCFSGNRLQGGYLRVGSLQLKQIPIPSGGLSQCSDLRGDRLIGLVDQMLNLFQEQASASVQIHPSLLLKIQAIEGQIDQLVYELYHLTDAEIEAVQSVTPN